MKKRWFQNFRFNKSRYERPQGDWICGHHPDGYRCPLGPTAKGTCQTVGECQPHKKNDRWICSRPEDCGGPCENGPLPDGQCCRKITPCQPLPAIRARRGRVVFSAAALAFGFLFVAFAGRTQRTNALPGQLSKEHASMQENCEACHAAGAEAPVDWLQVAFFPKAHGSQNQRCLECHHNLKQPFFENPHSLNPDHLNAHTERSSQYVKKSLTDHLRIPHLSVPANEKGEIACASCHREHHGADAKLTEMTSTQCQTCHQQIFAGFSKGHPSFVRSSLAREDVLDWEGWMKKWSQSKVLGPKLTQALPEGIRTNLDPAKVAESPELQREVVRAVNRTLHLEGASGSEKAITARRSLQAEFPQDLSAGFFYGGHRRPSIAFNHQSHLNGYFTSAKGNVATACTDCHQPEPGSQSMAFIGFQQACASCHMSMITTSTSGTSGGVALLRVPAVDVVTMRRKGRSIGSYPVNAEGELSVFTKLLIAGDSTYPEFAQDLKELRLMESWGDLSEASDVQLKAMERLVWGVKRLYVEIDAKGKEALRTRLEKATRGRLSPETIEYLLKPMPLDVMKGLQARALPQAPSEVREKKWPATHEANANADTENFALLYQPKRHTDNYLQAWLSAVAMSPAASGIFESTPGQYASFASCLICHSTESIGSGEVKIHWHGTPGEEGMRELTKYSHRPHLTMACNTCHQLEGNTDTGRFKSAYHRTNPASLEPVFKPISQATCLECHTPNKVGDDCLTCHQYHIGKFPERMIKTPIALPK